MSRIFPVLYTSINRDDLFTWLERAYEQHRNNVVSVHTWEYTDHPTGIPGITFTLYAITIVVVDEDTRILLNADTY